MTCKIASSCQSWDQSPCTTHHPALTPQQGQGLSYVTFHLNPNHDETEMMFLRPQNAISTASSEFLKAENREQLRYSFAGLGTNLNSSQAPKHHEMPGALLGHLVPGTVLLGIVQGGAAPLQLLAGRRMSQASQPALGLALCNGAGSLKLISKYFTHESSLY